MELILTRSVQTLNATYGIISVGNRPICLTLEPPWRMNERNRSCIPHGIYEIETIPDLTRTGKFYVIVKDVPERAGIEIHSGNSHHDTNGCILTGEYFNQIDYGYLVNSRKMLDILVNIIQENMINVLYVKNLPIL